MQDINYAIRILCCEIYEILKQLNEAGEKKDRPQKTLTPTK